jgi:hypothetical protein
MMQEVPELAAPGTNRGVAAKPAQRGWKAVRRQELPWKGVRTQELARPAAMS